MLWNSRPSPALSGWRRWKSTTTGSSPVKSSGREVLSALDHHTFPTGRDLVPSRVSDAGHLVLVIRTKSRYVLSAIDGVSVTAVVSMKKPLIRALTH